MRHSERHPQAGQTIKVDIGNGPVDFRLEDWWDHLTGGSWMDAVGNPAAMRAFEDLKLDFAKVGVR